MKNYKKKLAGLVGILLTANNDFKRMRFERKGGYFGNTGSSSDRCCC